MKNRMITLSDHLPTRYLPITNKIVMTVGKPRDTILTKWSKLKLSVMGQMDIMYVPI